MRPKLCEYMLIQLACLQAWFGAPHTKQCKLWPIARKMPTHLKKSGVWPTFVDLQPSSVNEQQFASVDRSLSNNTSQQ